MSIPAWIPTAISIIALLSSVSLGVWAANDRKANFQISREREIYSWAENTLGIIPDLHSSNTEVVAKAKTALSVQIDIGRLLFPNDHRGEYGQEKHPLNRGFRSKVLDPLVELHEFELPVQNGNQKEFTEHRKDFIWEVSKYFPPVKPNTSPESLAQFRTKN